MLIRLDCLSSIIGDFWLVVCGALCVCRVAIPLVMRSRSFFSPVFAFPVFVRVLGGVLRFRALCGEI